MVVHPGSGRISRVRPYSGILHRALGFRLRGSHPVSPTVPGRSSTFKQSDIKVLQPPAEAGFGLLPFRSPLLRQSRLISFPPLLRCFSSRSIPLHVKWSHKLLRLWGFPIRKSSAGSACLAADRSLSQLATSFIGVQSRGIRVMR